MNPEGERMRIVHVAPGRKAETREKFARWFANGGVQVWECRALDSAHLGNDRYTPHDAPACSDIMWKWQRGPLLTDPSEIEVQEEALPFSDKLSGKDNRDPAAAEDVLTELAPHVEQMQIVDLHLPTGIFSAVRFERRGDHARGVEYHVCGPRWKGTKYVRFETDGPDYYISCYNGHNQAPMFYLSPWRVWGLVDDGDKKRGTRYLCKEM